MFLVHFRKHYCFRDACFIKSCSVVFSRPIAEFLAVFAKGLYHLPFPDKGLPESWTDNQHQSGCDSGKRLHAGLPSSGLDTPSRSIVGGPGPGCACHADGNKRLASLPRRNPAHKRRICPQAACPSLDTGIRHGGRDCRAAGRGCHGALPHNIGIAGISVSERAGESAMAQSRRWRASRAHDHFLQMDVTADHLRPAGMACDAD